MEGLIFQWDKACDAMPLLRPVSKLFAMLSVIVLVFVILPSIFMPENERRPDPLSQGSYDANKAKYVETSVLTRPAESRHNVEPESIIAVVDGRDDITDEVKPSNIVRQVFEGGIGRRASESSKEDEPWDYRTEVAYIIETGFGENTFKINTGVFVDTRNLHKTGKYLQHVTVKAPTNAYTDLKNHPVTVTKMRDVETQCIYYSMEIFGKRRLVLGGGDGKIEVSC